MKPHSLALLLAGAFVILNSPVAAQEISKMKATIHHTGSDFAIAEFQNVAWEKARGVEIGRYWNDEPASAGRHFSTRMLWSDKYLYVRFEAKQSESLVVSEKANLATKTRGLWDRDVAEIFIAPNRNEPWKYFEFEIAPNGEWIDLGIDLASGKRVTDWDFRSGMESAAKIEKHRVLMAIKIPWKSLGKTPAAGDIWLGNLYRCVGKNSKRGYLAWRPTLSAEPAFHVPEKFGEFEFVK